MGMAASDLGTSEAVSVASTATARVVEIDGGDPRHHRRNKRKLYRSETRLGTDEVAGESFQVNQTCTLGQFQNVVEFFLRRSQNTILHKFLRKIQLYALVQ